MLIAPSRMMGNIKLKDYQTQRPVWCIKCSSLLTVANNSRLVSTIKHAPVSNVAPFMRQNYDTTFLHQMCASCMWPGTYLVLFIHNISLHVYAHLLSYL